MKRVLSKLLWLLVLFILISSFIFTNTAFAAMSAEKVINLITNVIGGIVSIVFWPKRIMITAIAFIANTVATTISSMDGTKISFVTPFNIFFNEVKILDVNFFDLDSLPDNATTYKIRVSVTKWFYIMRLISVAILLIILIYVGIRMAISTIADEKSRYKKMLFDWVCSLALVFVIPYIAIFTIHANSAIVNALKVIVDGQEGMAEAIGDIGLNAVLGIGINSIVSVAVYALIIFQIIGFIIAYFNRMLKTAFLLIISPLISITYSIDKMGDGKAQALNNWLKEFVYTILIQPFHCLIYMTFISVSFYLLVNPGTSGLIKTTEYNQLANGILAILCIKFIKDAEQMIRQIFNFKDDGKGTSLAAGLVATTYAISKAKDFGKTAKKGINFAKENNLGKALGKDIKGSKLFDKFQKSSLGTKVSNLSEKGKNFIKDAKRNINTFKKDKLGRFIRPLDKAWNSKPIQWMRGRNSLASAIGIATGLAHYASGNANVLQAIGTGSATKNAADEFLSSSAGTLGEGVADNIDQINEDDKKEMQENLDKANEKIKESGELIEQNASQLEDVSKNLDDVNSELEELQSEVEDSESDEQDEESEESSDEEENQTENSTESSNEGNGTEGNTDAPEETPAEAGTSERTKKVKRIQELQEQKQKLEEEKQRLEEEQQRLEEEHQSLIENRDTIIQQNNMGLDTTNSTTSQENMESTLNKILMLGATGKYDKGKSKEYENIVTRLQALLSSMDRESQVSELINSIQSHVRANSKSFELESTLQRVLGNGITNDGDKYEELRSLTRQLKRFEHESIIYEQLKLGNDMGVSTEGIAKKAYRRYENS